MSPVFAPPAGFEVLPGARDGDLGNRLLICGTGDATRLLKIYRPRRPWPIEPLTELSVPLTGKAGKTPRSRFDAERTCLELWKREGFDVFRTIDEPIPPEFAPCALWLEYCPGELLLKHLRRNEVDWESKSTLLARLGEEMGRRHRLALERDDIRLLHGFGGLQHVMLFEGRLITFDFERIWTRRISLQEGLARELANYLHSIAKAAGERLESALEAWLMDYGPREVLEQALEWSLHGTSLHRRLWRWRHTGSGKRNSKLAVLEQLRATLDGHRR